jgi:hypothetical protein
MNPEKENRPATTDLNLPVFDMPRRDLLSLKMSWEVVINHTEPMREFYMKRYDSPERRLRNKNPAPFRMDPPEA